MGAAATSGGLDGTWKPVAAYVAGEMLPVHELRVARLVFDDGGYSIVDDGERVLDRGHYEADAQAVPAALDIIGVEGPYAGRTLRAIFELDGDMLTVCYDLDGGDRPQTMQPEEGQLLLTITYARSGRSLS